MIYRVYTEDQRAPVITKTLSGPHTCKYENTSLDCYSGVAQWIIV